QAYLLQVSYENEDTPPHTLLVIDTQNNFRSIASIVGDIVNQVDDIPNPPVDITLYSDEDDGISGYCREITPFFRRGH
ncbi:MAG: enhanced serine sensitivity protein SseB C-terminal domain-containing protein, partial [Coxiellaceae bacterium]|nr:enhanced serine sensitivity protein SseB C-terminal domain-containing protein [Coxiellaceae bacterium]